MIIGSGGTLMIGNPGDPIAATQSLTTNNLVELGDFSALQLTLDPTARKSGQLRAGSQLTIERFADLHLALVNDKVLPDGTKFTLIDYGAFADSQHFFNSHPDGSTFVLGLNHYRINYADTPDPGYGGAITLTVVPAVPPASLTPAVQTVTSMVGAPLTQTAAMIPSGFGGMVTYSISPGLPNGLTFNNATGAIFGTPAAALTPTAFTIRGTGSVSGTATATVNLSIGVASQTISFGPAPTPTFAPGGGFPVFASASSGLPVTYSSLTPAICEAHGSTIMMLGAGVCTIAANQPGNANYTPAPQATQTIVIGKATPKPLVLSAVPPKIKVGETSALSISGGGSTGAISYTLVSGPCSLSGAALKGTGTGSCVVTASQAADKNYTAINSNPATVTVGLTPQTALVLTASPTTINANATSTLSTTGGSGAGAVTYAIISGSCTIAGAALTSSVSGSCIVVATKAADSTYDVVSSSPVTVTVNKIDQTPLSLVANPATLSVNAASALSTHGGSGLGAVTYSVTSGPCTASGSILTATGAGTCVITATKAADPTYNAVTSSPVSITVSLTPQAALILSASPASINVGATSTLSTTGGNGAGAVIYALTSGPCTLSGNLLTGTGSGSCLVTASKAADSVYAAATSNPIAVPVGLTPQTPLILTATPATLKVGNASTLSTTGGDGTGAVTYNLNDGPCTLSGNTLTGAGQGQCHVTATKAGDGTYGAASSNTVSVTVDLATQTPLLLTATPTGISTTGTSTLSTTGGSGTGAVTFAVTSGACTISGVLLGSTVADSCTVVATKAADSSFGAATSNTVTVTVGLAPQTPLVLIASPASIRVKETSALGVSGGDGPGAVSYAVTGPCTLVGDQLTGTASGNCTVTATKAAGGGYQAATSNPVTVSITSGAQNALVLTANPSVINVNGVSTLSTTGGSGSGIVSYTVVSGPCTLANNLLTATGVGQCQVTATKAADSNYGEATSNPVTVTVNRLAPPALVLSATPTSVGFGGSSTLSTTGGIPGAAVSYSVTGPCSVSGNTLIGIRAGLCTVTASQAATSVYSAATSNPVIITVKERTTTFSYPQGAATMGKPFTLTPTFSGFAKPTFALLYGSLPAGLTLNLATGVISGTPTGPAGTFDGVISVYENNAYDAALAVITVQTDPTDIPTLSEWGMLLLGLMLAGTAWQRQRRFG